ISRDLLRRVKKRSQYFRALPPSIGNHVLHFCDVPDSQLSRRFGRSLFVSKQNNFRIPSSQRPALQRIPLNHPVMPGERLSRREKRNHFCRLLSLTTKRSALPRAALPPPRRSHESSPYGIPVFATPRSMALSDRS